MSLLNRLRRELQVLLDYDAVIGDQVEEGIVEKVSEPTSGEVGRVHYLSHHAVIGRQIKKKLRIVYDASCKSNGAYTLSQHLPKMSWTSP